MDELQNTTEMFTELYNGGGVSIEEDHCFFCETERYLNCKTENSKWFGPKTRKPLGRFDQSIRTYVESGEKQQCLVITTKHYDENGEYEDSICICKKHLQMMSEKL